MIDPISACVPGGSGGSRSMQVTASQNSAALNITSRAMASATRNGSALDSIAMPLRIGKVRRIPAIRLLRAPTSAMSPTSMKARRCTTHHGHGSSPCQCWR